MARSSTFSLRLRSPRLRALMQEIAQRESISQNELIEQALEHELVARGAMWAEDLRAAADRLTALTDAQHESLLKRSLVEFAGGEGRRDPLRVRRITREPASVGAPAASVVSVDRLGVIAAYHGSR